MMSVGTRKVRIASNIVGTRDEINDLLLGLTASHSARPGMRFEILSSEKSESSKVTKKHRLA